MVDQPGEEAARPAAQASQVSPVPAAGGTPADRQAFWKRWGRPRGRPLPPIRPWPRRQWPLLVVLAGVVASLVVVVVVDFRPGTALFACSVLLAAVFRLVLTTRRAGLLVLRSRMTDVVTLAIMGGAALVLALAVPDIR
ncbi:DUF3017 domain-containing protein [Actinopolymorpha rutila]|uniref:DUF3017 domain-containing protein n=1 Tax=Actinopolymorpha rutila TaxID=446787 RepID=A0A852ZJG7_9ACTN|nr:DUF3017 domain-containing protein [Actinopolymorpha rutila]NYH91752.1 hypothetical protein [Actinopolymorpha rutila]